MNKEIQKEIKENIRDIKDFPIQGIIYKDITPALQNTKIFQKIINEFLNRIDEKEVDYIVGIESRGFILAGAIAYQLRKGFIPIRKAGKLPYKTNKVSYDLEYGSNEIEIHQDSFNKGDKIIIIDDVLATGGTIAGAVELIQGMGGDINKILFLIELSFLKGKEKIKNIKSESIIHY